VLPEVFFELVNSAEGLRDATTPVDGAWHIDGTMMDILCVTMQLVRSWKCQSASRLRAAQPWLGRIPSKRSAFMKTSRRGHVEPTFWP
jgi:hypothetical protein